MNPSAAELSIPQPIPTALTRRAPWILLFGRSALFFSLQALFALGYLLAGSTGAWNAGAAWWTFGVFITNFICLALMIRLFRAEGKNFWEIYRIRRTDIKGDLLTMLGILVIAGPVAMLPNFLIGTALFGDMQAVLPLLLRPLPLWAIYIGIALFPLTQGLAELPLYFLYVMPRLKAHGLRPWQAVLLPAMMLGLQHLFLPLLPDARFIAWRGLMFLPFAFLVGIVLNWRPRLLPYVAAVHVLMDLSFAMMYVGIGAP